MLLAVGADAVALARAYAYLSVTPADIVTVRGYMEGRSGDLQVGPVTSNEAFQALVTAASSYAEDGETVQNISIMRVAALIAMRAGTAFDDLRFGISGVHLGALTTDDIEEVLVTVDDEDYGPAGAPPAYIDSLAEHYAEMGVRVRARRLTMVAVQP